MGAFEITGEFEKAFHRDICKAPKNRETEADKIIVKALPICPKMSSKVLCAFWKKCGQLNYVLQDCATAILIPIGKKEDKAQPQSYIPIAVLSHARKVVEAAFVI